MQAIGTCVRKRDSTHVRSGCHRPPGGQTAKTAIPRGGITSSPVANTSRLASMFVSANAMKLLMWQNGTQKANTAQQ